MMINKFLNAFALLAGAMLLAVAARAQSVTHVQSGGWMETDFLDYANPGCSIGVDGSEPGSRMVMGVSRKRPDPANLVFRKVSWTIPPGLSITVQATFDSVPMLITGIGSGNSISVDLSGETMRQWVHNLTAANSLRLAFLGGRGSDWLIDLSGSSTVVNAMGDCVRSHQLVGVGAPFSVAVAAPAPVPTFNTPSGSMSPGPETPSVSTSSAMPGVVTGEPVASAPISSPSAVLAPSRDPVIVAWSGSSTMQTRPFHVDGPWEIQWMNGEGFFSITVHPLGAEREKNIASSTDPGSSSYFLPNGGDFYVEIQGRTPWQVRAVSIATPAYSAPTASAAAPFVATAPNVRLAPVIGGDGQPIDEASFVQAVQAAHSQYDSAPSEFGKGAARPARKQAICRILHSAAVRGWTGKIETLSTNGDGKGVVSIEIAPGVHVKTWNNALSDITDQTMIEPSSSLYRAMSAFRTGQTVRFSGRLLPSETDCVEEASMTLRGSMTAPEFIIRFEQIDGL